MAVWIRFGVHRELTQGSDSGSRFVGSYAVIAALISRSL